MFKKARLKLTFWYLLIIMTISLSFSAFIYKSVNVEFQRQQAMIERRIQLGYLGFVPQPGQIKIFFEEINEARGRVLFTLAYTNVVILSISALAGYFLAGKTLNPIESSIEEQKRFISDASHELKTPLTSLKTSIEVNLRDKKLTLKDAKQTLSDNLGEIDQLKDLANNLLSLARYEQNEKNLDREKVEIKELFKKVTKAFSPIAKEKGIKLKIIANSLFVFANRDSVEKLIGILLDNAIKYSLSGGSVTISAVKSGNNVSISVKNVGVGIAKEDLPHIFDRFYRADMSRSKLYTPGFGLGLSIAKRIVEIHKGTISVRSTPNKETVFTVILPTKA